jgi:hypothetical protein
MRHSLVLLSLIVTTIFSSHVNVRVVDADTGMSLHVEYLTLDFGEERNVIRYRVGDDEPVPVPSRYLKRANSVTAELRDGGVATQEIALYYGPIDESNDMILRYRALELESEPSRRWWLFVNKLEAANWKANYTE